MAAILRLYSFWQDGRSIDAENALQAARETVSCMKAVAGAVGRKYNTPKCHDLYHIHYDLVKFGKASNVDTGMLT